MWIRTQDKEILTPANSAIYVHPRQETIDKKVFDLNTNIQAVGHNWERDCIGTFPTKEAALEELDRIERWLEAGGHGVYQVSGE